MFRWMHNLMAGSNRRSVRSVPRRIVRARYDAAVTNDDNRRHWAAADGLSANSANSAEVRRILRNRARYEVSNNSYARGMVLTLAHDVVGTGPRLQMLTESPEANRRIEREFARWTTAIRLAEKLRTMRGARATDGESFALLTSNPKLPLDVQLDLRLIEADQVTTPDPRLDVPVDGILFDTAGNPVEYHLLKEHPGASTYRRALAFDRIPAESILHWYRIDRPGPGSRHSGHHPGAAALRATAAVHACGPRRRRDGRRLRGDPLHRCAREWRSGRGGTLRADRTGEASARDDARRLEDVADASGAARDDLRRVQAGDSQRDRPRSEHAVQRRGG